MPAELQLSTDVDNYLALRKVFLLPKVFFEQLGAQH